MGVKAIELPAGALLERYRADPLPGCEPAYVDCYAVSVPGSFNDEVGCAGDWQPDCSAIDLVPNGSTWSISIDIPAGDYEY